MAGVNNSQVKCSLTELLAGDTVRLLAPPEKNQLFRSINWRTTAMLRATILRRNSLMYAAGLTAIIVASPTRAQEPGNRPVLRQAEVNANDVYVRSGDSTNHYTVCKLAAGAKVAVLSQRGDWVEILPPDGTFSLISGDYVDTSDDKTGVVSGSNVRVRAGSSLNESKYTVQTMLSRGAPVTILGRNPDGFLRIRPPVGATLWVHADFLAEAPGSMIPGQPPASAPASSATTKGIEGDEDPAKINRRPLPLASPVGTIPGTDTAALDLAVSTWRQELEELDAAGNAEMEKIPGDRDFAPLLSRYKTVMDQDDDDYAKRYAEIRHAQIENIHSLATAVATVRAMGAKADAQRREFMDKRASLPRIAPSIPSGLTAQGELRMSALYPPGSTVRRYRLIDPSASFERTIGYVEIPSGQALDVNGFIGRYVGVRASETRLQKGGVDPIPIYIAQELVLLEAPANAGLKEKKD